MANSNSQMPQLEQAYQQAMGLIQKGRFREVAPLLAQLVKKQPSEPRFWHLYSVVALSLRQAKKGIEFSQRAMELAPENPDYRVQMANARLHTMDQAGALSDAAVVESMTGLTARTWDVLGSVYTGCGEMVKAQAAFEKAVTLEPGVIHYQFNLATALRGNGDLEAAEAIYDKVIEATPKDYEAYANRSQLRKQTVERNHISQLKGLLEKGIDNWRHQVQICFALAKECEDVGRYEESFKALQQGANLRRQQTRYQVEGDLQAINKIISTFDQEVIDNARPGCDSEEPIFILGLPRTGTTLVERIVDSHSAVNSAGELQNFASEMIKLVVAQNPNQKLDKYGMIEKSIGIDFEQLGKAYINGTRPLTGQSPHFIDKLPLNYLYIGLIAMALPKAKIIHLTRNPMDACYAIYKTLFNEAYPFSYNLDDLGRYYLAYYKLMDHWRQVLPGRILDVSYENLVQNQDTESRRLIDYCGLDWQEQCLQFYNNPQASMTASAAQVRQPLYSSSVGKWRHYEKQLAPLKVLLETGGISCG